MKSAQQPINEDKKKIDYIFCSPNLYPAVSAAGILPFDHGHTADHRALYVDWNADLLFQGNTADITPPVSRRLSTKNARATRKYLKTLQEFFHKHKIVSKVRQLSEDKETTYRERQAITDELIERYELLDKIITEGMIRAEKSCNNAHSGDYHWSPALHEAGQIYRYWKLRL